METTGAATRRTRKGRTAQWTPTRTPQRHRRPTEERPYTFVAPDRAALLAAASATEDSFTIQRIFDDAGIRLIRIAFAAGQVMREHSTNAPLLVQVLSGEIAFAVAGEVLDLHEGSVLFVRPGELHELTARTDAHVLLTLHTSHRPAAPHTA